MATKYDSFPGFAPEDPAEEMRGLESAIKKTKERILADKASKFDVTELEQHLKSLEDRWYEASKKSRRAA